MTLPTLIRAILASDGPLGLLGRPWRGLGRPMRVLWGPTAGLRPRLAGADEAPSSLPAVIGGISLLADGLAAMDWAIVRRSSTRAGTDIVDTSPAALTLSSWPHFERWAWLWNAFYSGNGVALVHDDGRGAPQRLETFPAERVSFRLFDDGTLHLLLTPVTAGEVAEVAEDRCAIFRYRPAEWDPRIGVSPLVQAAPTIEMLLANRSMVRAVQLNAARPSSYLKTDQKIDPRRAEEIAQRWAERHGGEGRGSTAILEEGLSYHTVDNSDLNELAAVETARIGVGDIARLYNIPAALLLGIEQSRNSAVEDRRRLLAFSLSPAARLAESALGAALLTAEQRRQGYAVRIDDSVAMLGQGSELGQAISSLLNSGAVSVNEARARIGLAAVANGDKLRAPANTWPIDAWAEAVPRSADTAPASDMNSAHALAEMTRQWRERLQ